LKLKPFFQFFIFWENKTPKKTRPAWAGFKTAEEGRAKILKISMLKVIL
jgi:hypothetical protein